MCRKYIIRSIVIMTIIISVIGTWYYTNKGEQIVLEFGMFTGSNWGVENADSFLIIDRAIARFEKKHPNVKVKYTSGIDKKDYSEWCAKKLLSGNLPDVFMVLDTDFNLYYKLGVLQELDSYMEQDLEFNKEDFFKTALDIGKGIGEEKVQYALPYEVVPTLLFVNKTLLKQENIDIPDKEWTWEEFYNICKKVTKDTDQDGRVDQFGTYNYTWLDAMYTSGGSLFEDENEKINFSSKYMIESLKFMKNLNDLNKGEKVTQEDFDANEEEIIENEKTFYQEIKPQIDKLFQENKEEGYLNKIFPNSKWVKVNLDNGDYYVFGLIYQNEDVKYICYGVPGIYQKVPPRELAGYPAWLPLDNDNQEGFGYWLTYQDAQSGESVKAIVE